jgi:hypothetical protein
MQQPHQYDSGLEPARQDFPEVSQDQQGEQGYGYQHHHQQQQPYQPTLPPAQQPYYQQHQHLPAQQQHQYYPQPYDGSATLQTKPQDAAVAQSPYGSNTIGSSPFSAHSEPLAAATDEQRGKQPPPGPGRTVCGCSLLVLILSCIIALLSAAVIGLAAATGVEAQRASSAQSSLAALNASAATATAGAAPSPTPTQVIDDGCSEDPASADKSSYTSFYCESLRPLFTSLTSHHHITLC